MTDKITCQECGAQLAPKDITVCSSCYKRDQVAGAHMLSRVMLLTIVMVVILLLWLLLFI